VVKALLVIMVMGGAGPAGTKPFRLADGVIEVRHNHSGPVIARASSGLLRVHLRPGLYSVKASLGPPNPSHPCEVTTIRVRQGRINRLRMTCNLK
jgi:hypothetical protein